MTRDAVRKAFIGIFAAFVTFMAIAVVNSLARYSGPPLTPADMGPVMLTVGSLIAGVAIALEILYIVFEAIQIKRGKWTRLEK